MMKLLPALLLFASLLFSFAAEPKPNLIYMMVDDLGYGDLSCYGQEHFTTPNIDRLATEGMKFTDHYAGSTVCAPTRCVLMTGLHTGHAFIRGNKEIKPVGQHPMADACYTVAELFKENGYATGAFGKWGLGAPGSEGDPVHQGFDKFYGYNCQRNAHTFYPTWLYDNLKKVEFDGKTYSHDVIAEQCLAWIREQKDTPFFCYIPFTIPHAAMQVPADDHDPWREKFPQFEGKVGKYGGTQVTNPVAAFAGMMTRLDRDIGRILDLLKELGIDDDTLVIFTSDNGPHKEGGHDPIFFDSNGPLNGFKRDLTDGGIRVPHLARWPGKIKAGTESDHISAHWDLLATAAEMIGVEPPAGLDGISYLPELTGKEQAEHDFLYWEFFERGDKRAVRQGKWKAVQNDLHKNPDGPIMLFDLDKDLGETTDLAAEHPEKVKAMKQLMIESHTDSEIFVVKPPKPKKPKKAKPAA